MLAERLEPRCFLSVTYYLSPSGSDSNAGTSSSAPWKTITRANEQTYGPGDSLLLLGGSSFSGDLTLTSADAGTAATPMTISSYGSGSATISAGSTDGITVRDAGGISISNLNITGSGPSTNTGSGIDLIDDQTSQPQISNLTITNVNVGGFGFVGIGIGSTTLTTGFNDVSITYSTVYDNGASGIFSYAGQYTANPAPYGLVHSNIYVGHVTAYDNPGYSGNNDSGNGIELGNVNGATIERCVAYGNGADNSSTGGGPVGIWTYNSNNVVIQYNESYSNTAAHLDGDGFDLDGGTTNSIVQYNYSENNAGAGILEAQFPGAQPSTGNIIRYNISQNDGRTQSEAGIALYSASATDTINGTQIYGNTIYVSKSAVGSPSALRIYQATDNVTVRNNIFDVASGLNTISVAAAGTGLALQDNDYWTGSAAAIDVSWVSKNYSTLSTWQSATGEEKNGSTLTGFAVNPMLYNPGNGSTTPTADTIDTITAYAMLQNSPLFNTGMNLTAAGVNPGSTDYFGDALPSNANFSVGVDQDLAVIPALSLTSTAATSFYLQPNSAGVALNIWENSSTPGSGIPTLAVAIAELTSVQIGGGTGSSFTVDLSNGDSLGSLPIAIAGSSNSTLTVIGTGATDSAQVAANVLTFDDTPITYSGAESILINGGNGAVTLTQTQQPSAAVTLTGTGADTLVVQSGVYTFTGAITATNLAVEDQSSVIFAAATAGSGITTRQLASLSISAGATAQVSPTGAHADRLLLELGGLTIATTGQLNLQNNDMLIHNGNLGVIMSQLAQGRSSSGQSTPGDGITSSAIATNTAAALALGVMLNSNSGSLIYGSGTSLGLFDGQSPALSDVLVKYTYMGDTNLDGKVDASDYSRVDSGYLHHLTGWYNGDFNYDSVINGSDYTLIDDAFNIQYVSLAATVAASNINLSSPLKTVHFAGAFTAAQATAEPQGGACCEVDCQSETRSETSPAISVAAVSDVEMQSIPRQQPRIRLRRLRRQVGLDLGYGLERGTN